MLSPASSARSSTRQGVAGWSWTAWTTRDKPVDYELDISAAAGPVTVRPLLGPAEVKPLDNGAIPLRLTLEPVFLRAKAKDEHK